LEAERMPKLGIINWIRAILLLCCVSTTYTEVLANSDSLVVADIPVLAQIKLDPRCPPINTNIIAAQFRPEIKPSGTASRHYRLNLSTTKQFNLRVQAYVRYLQAINPKIHTLTSRWRVYDKGLSHSLKPPVTPGLGNIVSEFNSSLNDFQGPSFGNMQTGYPLQANHWYRVLSWSQLNIKERYFPRKCETAQYWITWRVVDANTTGQRHASEIVLSDGRRVVATLPVKPKTKRAPTDWKNRLHKRQLQ